MVDSFGPGVARESALLAHVFVQFLGIDPILAACDLVTSLQTVVTKEVKAIDSAVISVTQFISGSAYNIIPDDAVIRGCTRYQTAETGAFLTEALERMSAGVCAVYGTRYSFRHMPGYPPTVNSPAETRTAVRPAVSPR